MRHPPSPASITITRFAAALITCKTSISKSPCLHQLLHSCQHTARPMPKQYQPPQLRIGLPREGKPMYLLALWSCHRHHALHTRESLQSRAPMIASIATRLVTPKHCIRIAHTANRIIDRAASRAQGARHTLALRVIPAEHAGPQRRRRIIRQRNPFVGTPVFTRPLICISMRYPQIIALPQAVRSNFFRALKKVLKIAQHLSGIAP